MSGDHAVPVDSVASDHPLVPVPDSNDPDESDEHRALGGPVPIAISVRTRNLLIVAVLVALLVLFWQVPTIPTIALGGGFLALILSFPVRFLSRLMPRGFAIFVATFGLFLGLVLLILGIVPVLIEQLTALIGALPTVAADVEALLRDAIMPLQERGVLTEDTDTVIADLRDGAITRANELAENALGGLLGTVTGILDFAVAAFGIVFVAVYLLVDIRRIRLATLRSLPAAHRWDAEDLWDRFGTSLSRYLAGLATSLAVQGILTWLALSALGVPYAFLLGFWVSLTAIIPYLGAFLGAIPAVILAFIVSPTTGFLTLGLYIVIQQLESNFLTPRIQGQAVRVHPIIVLLAVIAANELFGLAGAIFAVPALAVGRVLIDFLVARLRVQP